MAGNGNGDWWDALTGGVSNLDFTPAQDYLPNLLGYGSPGGRIYPNGTLPAEKAKIDADYAARQAALAQRSQVKIPIAPPQYSPGTPITGGGRINPAYTDWQNKYGQQDAENHAIQDAQVC